MFRLKFVVVFLLVSFGSKGQILSEKASISVLTFGPGKEELYAGFGHSAIRVYDPANNIDWAFNYGTFDFDQPNFYLNFTRGQLLYKLAVQDFKRMKQYYEYFNRYILEQIVDLDSFQRQKVFDFLIDNAKPENADYYYDYFYNNCSTKIGDVFVAALGEDFKFNEDFVDEPGLTIRNLTDRLTADEFPWGKLGIDLCLGLPMDKQLTNLEYMFLPDYVHKAFNRAEVRKESGWQNAVAEDRILFNSVPSSTTGTTFTPNLVFWMLFVVGLSLTIWSELKNISLNWLDVFLFILIGLLGSLLTLLWLATDHKAAAWNMNILWALPTHLLFGISLIRRGLRDWQIKYAYLVVGMSLILLITWSFLPQQLNWAMLPVALLLGLRSMARIRGARRA